MLTFRHEEHIVKEVVGLRGGLKKSHQHGGLSEMAEVPQSARDLEGGAAV